MLGILSGAALCYCQSASRRRKQNGAAQQTTDSAGGGMAIYDTPSDPVHVKKSDPDISVNLAYGVTQPLPTSPNVAYELVQR